MKFRVMFAITTLLVASCHAAPAFARHHHYRVTHSLHVARDHHRHVARPPAAYVAPDSDERTGGASPRHDDPPRGHGDWWHQSQRAWPAAFAHSVLEGHYSGTSRPSDCYGIAWCGCWLRHQFGIADRSLNLAWNWARKFPSAGPDSANVAVWPHHVGKVLQVRHGPQGTEVLLQSGNDMRGSNEAHTRWRPLCGRRGCAVLRRV